MRWMKIILAVVVAVMMNGCWTLSIHPLYTDDEIVVDDMIEGKWYPSKSRDQIWMFEKNNDDSYRLTVIEEGVKEQLDKMEDNNFRLMMTIDPTRDGIFEAHLLRLGDELFLDIFPEYPESGNEFYISHLIPGHSFMRVSIQGNVLLLSGLNMEWLKEGIEAGEIDIKHERSQDVFVLTAGTAKLQEFVLQLEQVLPEN